VRYLSVCSGIEAATVAWEPLGLRATGFAEIDPFASAVLAHHYPHTYNHGDFTNIARDAQECDALGSIDVLVGGTPCQSFSVAGLRKGMDDARGQLALEYLRLARRINARWIVWENVPGVLSSNGGRDFGAFLGGLGELGYGCAYRVLDAQYFGVPQRRRRVFVVGYLGDWRRAAAVLFERHSLQRHPPPGRQAGQGVAGTLASRTGAGGGLGTDFDLSGGVIAPPLTLNPYGDHESREGLLVARCLTSSSQRMDAGVETLVAHTLRGEGFDASEDGTGRGAPLVAFNCMQDIHPSDASPSSATGSTHGQGNIAIAFDTTQITSAENRSQPADGKPCHALAKDAHPPAIATASTVRRLTPRECERLQGFPDDYTKIPYGKRGRWAKDGPRYKALGNSMAVPVMAWIGRRILMAESIA
jgi:DNA (cytosine-5)-methyltransferase 1